MSNPPLFKSFWMAGYEGACHINESGKRLDMTSFVQHDRQVEQDYALLPGVGIEAARESVRWPLIEHSGQFDYSSITPMLKAANDQGVPVDGICLYPIMDRPDWENEKHWHNSGLWDLDTESKGAWRRILNENYAIDLKVAQNRLTQQTCNYQSIS